MKNLICIEYCSAQPRLMQILLASIYYRLWTLSVAGLCSFFSFFLLSRHDLVQDNLDLIDGAAQAFADMGAQVVFIQTQQ